LLGGSLWLKLEITSNLCDLFKRLALPDIICDWHNIGKPYVPC